MKKILSICSFLVAIIIYSQGITGAVQIKSPQSYSFEKYGNVPVNLYTGMLDMKIPINSLQINGENSIDVLLSYDSSGFIPHKKSDLAGVNWSLMAGGRITRIMKGVPDENLGSVCTTANNEYALNLNGFLTGVRNTPYTNSQVYNINNGAGSNPTCGTGYSWKLGTGSTSYETEPDIFNFNILNLHGKFMVGNNGSVLVESNDPGLKVDLSQVISYNLRSSCRPLNNTIKLIDSKGNKYYFGGDFSAFEIAYGSSSPVMYNDFINGYPYVNSFSISKIEFSDGKTVNFNYVKDTLDDYFCWDNPDFTNNEKLISFESYYQQGAFASEFKSCSSFLNCLSETTSGNSMSVGYSFLKKSLLESIIYGNSKVSFSYKDCGYSISHLNSISTNLYPHEYILDKIQISDNNAILQNTIFNYSDLGGIYKRPFLNSVTETLSNKTYSFEYYNTDNLPPYYTKGIDHWGYWNGNNSITNNLIVGLYDPLTGDYTLNNTTRDPNGNYCKTALLKKIIYPTKGYSVFDYEPHSYGNRIERTSTSNFLPTLTLNSGISGGARIKSQYDYSENGGITNEKTFQYTNALNSSVSSGILMNWPRYVYYFELTGGGQTSKRMIGSSSNVQQNSLDSYNVGYSKVYEIDKYKGYIEHNYTTYKDFPDVSPDTSNLLNWFYQAGGGQYNSIVPENLYKNLGNLYGIDKSILRGKPKQDLFFVEGSTNPVKKVEYEYTDNVNYNPNNLTDENNYVAVQHLTGFWVQGYKKYLNSSSLKKKVITDYLNGNPIINTIEYYYDSSVNLNLAREVNTLSAGTTTSKNYSYAQEKGNTKLINANMIGIPLETEVKKDGKMISKTETKYDNPSDLFPSSVLSYSLQNNTPTTELTYDQYDIKGNLHQYTTKDGISTTIIWGYNQTRPIAKIIGVKLSDISQTLINGIVTASNTDASAAPGNDESAFLALLDSFRKDPSMAGYQVTTYTYDPLIGGKKHHASLRNQRSVSLRFCQQAERDQGEQPDRQYPERI